MSKSLLDNPNKEYKALSRFSTNSCSGYTREACFISAPEDRRRVMMVGNWNEATDTKRNLDHYHTEEGYNLGSCGLIVADSRVVEEFFSISLRRRNL